MLVPSVGVELIQQDEAGVVVVEGVAQAAKPAGGAAVGRAAEVSSADRVGPRPGSAGRLFCTSTAAVEEPSWLPRSGKKPMPASYRACAAAARVDMPRRGALRQAVVVGLLVIQVADLEHELHCRGQ